MIELRGYHLHNELPAPAKNIDVGDEGEKFVTNTFLKNFETGKVKLPDGPNGELIEVPIADLGIKYPVVMTSQRVQYGHLYGGADRGRNEWRHADEPWRTGRYGARRQPGCRRTTSENVQAPPVRFHRAILLAAAAARRAPENDGGKEKHDTEHGRSWHRSSGSRAKFLGVSRLWIKFERRLLG